MAARTLADYPELVAEWHPTLNGDLRPEDITSGSGRKVWWKCYDGKWPDGSFADDHEWEASVSKRVAGIGCPCCSVPAKKVVPSNCLMATHPHIAEQWHPTKNGFLKPTEVLAGCNSKVWWKCYDGKWPNGDPADDHEWEACVNSRTYGGNGCPCCRRRLAVGSNNLESTHPDLANQWHPEKNGDLRPSDITSGYNGKVWWKCNKGTWPDGSFANDHEWQSPPNQRSSGSGCPCCAGKLVVDSNCLLSAHPELASQWHPTLNGNITPRNVTRGSKLKVWWKCGCGSWPDGSPANDHIWQAAVVDRACSGNSCPCCSGKQAAPSNSLQATYPDIASQWHPFKNGDLKPDGFTPGSGVKVWWKCSKATWPDGEFADDHEWMSAICDRTKGNGCPCCKGDVTVPSNCLATTHPELLKEWHPVKNELSPFDVTKGQHDKVWWKCHEGRWPNGDYADDHEWESSICGRTSGKACPCCVNRKTVPSNCLVTTDPDLASQWHPTKNAHLTAKDITSGSAVKVWWMCDKGHEWDAVVVSRASGVGCPKCQESKGEKKVGDVLTKLGLAFKSQQRFKKCKNKMTLPFDFIVRLTETKGFLIEYQGEQHYKPIVRRYKGDNKRAEEVLLKIQDRDQIKRKYAKNHNIPLLEIPYTEFDRIEEIIKDFINKLTSDS